MLDLMFVLAALFLYAGASADAEKPQVNWRKLMEAKTIDEFQTAVDIAEAAIDEHKSAMA